MVPESRSLLKLSSFIYGKHLQKSSNWQFANSRVAAPRAQFIEPVTCGLSAWMLLAIGASGRRVIGKPVLHTSCPKYERLSNSSDLIYLKAVTGEQLAKGNSKSKSFATDPPTKAGQVPEYRGSIEGDKKLP